MKGSLPPGRATLPQRSQALALATWLTAVCGSATELATGLRLPFVREQYAERDLPQNAAVATTSAWRFKRFARGSEQARIEIRRRLRVETTGRAAGTQYVERLAQAAHEAGQFRGANSARCRVALSRLMAHTNTECEVGSNIRKFHPRELPLYLPDGNILGCKQLGVVGSSAAIFLMVASR